MKSFLTSPKFIAIAVALIALVGIPLTIIQVQNQQTIQQQAEEILWLTDQSASATCPDDKSGVAITVSFTNTEPRKTSTDMNVVAKDKQTGKQVDMGKIRGGETKTSVIKTEKETLQSGSVVFSLTWSDGHSGVDSRTANYKAVNKCVQPSPTPTSVLTPAPSDQPTPTICPTLGPVQNVHIECPNCK